MSPMNTNDFDNNNNQNNNQYSQLSTKKHNIESYFYPIMNLPE